MGTSSQRVGTVAVITLDHPPVNALPIGGGLVSDLRRDVDAALADPACTAVVITGAGRFFSAGADSEELGNITPADVERIRRLFVAIEQSPKPVVAALNGDAIGSGFELALACHYRVAVKGAKVGLPEVTLGVLPGRGGTQRLPRLIGAREALALMLSGKPIAADRTLPAGLIDELVDSDPVAAALVLVADGKPPRPTSALPPPDDIDEAVASARAGLKRTQTQAPAFIIDCVEAMKGRSFEDGLAFESARFDELVRSVPAAALRHVFRGQRAVSRIPGLDPSLKPLPIDRVAVVGGGLMGTGISIALLNAGISVTLIEPRGEGREKAEKSIRSTIEGDVRKGRISSDVAGERLGRLTIAASLEAASGADMSIEAVFEDMAVKRDVFGALDTIMGPDAILASNTSTLDLNAIASFTGRPGRVVGLHFFSPANIMRLLEIVRGDETEAAVLATAMAFASRIGKVGVVSGVCDGFIGNRMFEEYLRQAYQLAEEGALPQQIDRAMEAFGFAMGPFRVTDLAGNDIFWSIRKRRKIEQPDRPYSEFPDRMCELGRFGQKVGKGFYLYADGRTATVDPEVEALLAKHSAEHGIVRREVADEEIVSRCLLALVNEGAKIVGEGIAYRPLDVDMVYIFGYGFPQDRGGPMFCADVIGIPEVLRQMAEFAKGRAGWAWEPAPLLLELAEKGASLGSLDERR